MPAGGVPVLPATIAVYAPGGRVASIADSRSLVGARPSALIWASCESLQLLFVMVPNAPGPWTSRVGSGKTSAAVKPNLDNEGPMARMMTCFGTAPGMVKPTMPTLFPVSVRMRVDRFNVCAAGAAVGVAGAAGGGASAGGRRAAWVAGGGG